LVDTVNLNSANSINNITVSLQGIGQNYTYANVIITDSVGQNASARVVISPLNGHGSDPLYELGAR
jgi:hypothetical protein